jgi:hypothetical protein
VVPVQDVVVGVEREGDGVERVLGDEGVVKGELGGADNGDALGEVEVVWCYVSRLSFWYEYRNLPLPVLWTDKNPNHTPQAIPANHNPR